MNDLKAVFSVIWRILGIHFEIWGLDFTFLQLALWGMVAGAVIWLVVYWMKG